MVNFFNYLICSFQICFLYVYMYTERVLLKYLNNWLDTHFLIILLEREREREREREIIKLYNNYVKHSSWLLEYQNVLQH